MVMSPLYLIIGALVILALFAISLYNKFVHQKALVNEGWSGIDVQLKRRYDLIPNLVETVKGYSTHEKSVFENVAKARSAAINASGVEQKANAEAGLTQALKTLFAVAESYPELKANENFLNLQENLNQIEQDLQLARRYYNGTARIYNTTVQRFPANMIAQLTGFRPVAYFELENTVERETPHVKF